MFFRTKPPSEVIAVFVHELLTPLCLYYHAIYTEVVGYVFSTTFTLWSVTGCGYVSYRLCCACIVMLLHMSYLGVYYHAMYT
jgi:hypothetical protein